MQIETWLDAEGNRDLCNIAGDLAHDTLAAYHDARDIPTPRSATECQQIAANIAFRARRGWEYAAQDDNDPAGEIAWKVLADLGFERRSGNIGFDATIIPATK